MLKKEFNEVLKQSVFFILLALLLPSVLSVVIDEPHLDIFFPLFQFGLLSWALFLGNFLFFLERGQRGMEYLLSLPYSRLQILGLKLVPRVLVLLVFFLCHHVLFLKGLGNTAAISNFFFTLAYFSLFLIAVSFSAVSKNFVISASLSLVFFCIYLILCLTAFKLALMKVDIPFEWMDIKELFIISGWHKFMDTGFAAVLILLIPFILAFVLSFRKFDIRPPKTFNKHFFKYFAPLLFLGFLLSALTAYIGINNPYGNYYLTNNNKLIVGDYFSFKVYDENNVYKTEFKDFSLWSSFDFKDYFVTQELNYKGNKYTRTICQMDMSSHEVKTLYKGRADRWPSPWVTWKYKNYYIFREGGKNPSSIMLTFLDMETGEVSRLEVNHPLITDQKNLWLLGTDLMKGKRFWILRLGVNRKATILQVWEDGIVDILGESRDIWPAYINNFLFLYEQNETKIFKLSTAGLEPVKEIPGLLSFREPFLYRGEIISFPLQKIYGGLFIGKEKTGKLVRLDLETLETTELGEIEGRPPYIVHTAQNEGYFVDWNKNTRQHKLYHLKDSRMQLIKEFTMSKIEADLPLDRIDIFRTGVITRIKGKVKVYSLPDMKEMKFKKLR